LVFASLSAAQADTKCQHEKKPKKLKSNKQSKNKPMNRKMMLITIQRMLLALPL